MSLLPTPCERYLGGFYVENHEPHDAVYRGRCARYIIVLDSYADAVAWRRVMTANNSFIVPLSQAAGEAAGQLRDAMAVADAEADAEAAAEAVENAEHELGLDRESEPPKAPESERLDAALDHLRALLVRPPAYTDYNELFVPVEKCAYCEAELADGPHAADCAWQAARKYVLETAINGEPSGQ